MNDTSILIVEDEGIRLCAHHKKRVRNQNEAGNPMFDCLCGDVLSASIDRTSVFFTAKGSFWCNSATNLLALTPEANRRDRSLDAASVKDMNRWP